MMKKNYLLLFLVFFVSGSIFGQSQEDIKKITAEYNIAKLKEKQAFYQKRANVEKQKAIATAKLRNWPIYVENPDGSIKELMRISPEGLPIYYTTDNVNAARSTRANHLNTGGSLGLSLDGQGMVARVWDGGTVRVSHNAFGGRVTAVDTPEGTSVLHATHVTGTVVAGPTPGAVKGMASQATARTFDWNNDEAEVISEALDGMLISNHSYGVPISGSGDPLPAWIIGAYIFDSYVWDEIAYEAPYYLAVMSAGNDGGNNDNAEPMAFGIDKLVANKTAKNNLVVANAQDAIVATDGTLTTPLAINSSSSQGPTDDLRIKPDITGNGTNLTSTSNASNTATASLSGTSMASPNVAGSLLLLQQHYHNLYNSYMRAATLKGLACHTADDSGVVGPDPIFGWGLLNCKKAAETLTNNGLSAWVSEENLANNQEFTMTVNASGTAPLIASITWTDVPGAINTGGLGANDPTPALVNDLDIRIVKNSTISYPWKLEDPNSAAVRTGDNDVDNVEQVKIDTPTAGQYTITVKHKGTLVNGGQKFSLVITGLASAFALNSTSDNLTICSNQNAVYTFNYTQTGGGSTTFSAVGLPSGASASFAPASLSANGTVTMTVTGLSGIAPGEYFVGIKGTSATETETRYKTLRVFNGTSFQPVTLQSPANAQNGLSTSAVLEWASQPNALTYIVQASTSSDFSSFFVNQSNVMGTEFNLTGLSQATRYYWRVIPQNNCGVASASNATVNYFDTGSLVCGLTFDATDFSDAAIADVPNSTASVPVTITGGYTIGDLNVNIDITHTWVQDLTIVLEGPASIGSPVITLLEEACGDNQNILCTMDDDGDVPACTGVPAITGNIAPVDSLSSLNTLPADGVWTLRVVDPYNEDGGSINAFSIDICSVEVALSVVTNPIVNSSVYPNPTRGTVNVSIPNLSDNASITLFDLQGRAIMTKETNQVHTSFGIENLQDGVYLVNIQNNQGSVTKKIVLKRN